MASSSTAEWMRSPARVSLNPATSHEGWPRWVVLLTEVGTNALHSDRGAADPRPPSQGRGQAYELGPNLWSVAVDKPLHDLARGCSAWCPIRTRTNAACSVDDRRDSFAGEGRGGIRKRPRLIEQRRWRRGTPITPHGSMVSDAVDRVECAFSHLDSL
jgi:hypothetical protein